MIEQQKPLILHLDRRVRAHHHVFEASTPVKVGLLINQLKTFFRSLIGLARRVYRIKHDGHHLVNHGRNEVPCEVTRSADVWIRVHLDQPGSQILVDHEIVAEKFEMVFPMRRVELLLDSHKRVNYYVFHPWNEVDIHLEFFTFQIRIVLFKFIRVKIVFELLKR